MLPARRRERVAADANSRLLSNFSLPCNASSTLPFVNRFVLRGVLKPPLSPSLGLLIPESFPNPTLSLYLMRLTDIHGFHAGGASLASLRSRKILRHAGSCLICLGRQAAAQPYGKIVI